MVLCSRNARPEKGLVRRPHLDQHGCPSKRGSTSELGRNMYIVRCAQGRTVWRLPWGVMECGCLLASCARGTRGRGLPSLGLMARLGVPLGGRVRRLRSVEDQSAPIPEEATSELGGSIYIVQSAQSRAASATPLKRDDRADLSGSIVTSVQR